MPPTLMEAAMAVNAGRASPEQTRNLMRAESLWKGYNKQGPAKLKWKHGPSKSRRTRRNRRSRKTRRSRR
jgi:hypothetical protein